MAQKHGALVVVGSGPGIGRNIAALFAERGFQKIVLMSRDTSRLQEDAGFVRAQAGGDTSVEIVPIDLADTDKVQKSLDDVDARLGGIPLESVLFNAARLGASKLMDFPAHQLNSDLNISVVSLYIVAQWAMPHLTKTTHDGTSVPSFLVTSGMLYKDPFPAMFSLATCKAAQYNLVHSLYKEYQPKGVHCALIVVGGRVADKSKVTNAKNVAEEAWRLHRQEKGKGDLDVVMLDPAYEAHIKSREQANRQ